MASKAAIIRDLLESTDVSSAEIAQTLGCLDAYVRVVQHRLLHGGRTPSERNWRAANPDRYAEINRRGSAAWARKNPDLVREKNRRYRARQRQSKAVAHAT